MHFTLEEVENTIQRIFKMQTVSLNIYNGKCNRKKKKEVVNVLTHIAKKITKMQF